MLEHKDYQRPAFPIRGILLAYLHAIADIRETQFGERGQRNNQSEESSSARNLDFVALKVDASYKLLGSPVASGTSGLRSKTTAGHKGLPIIQQEPLMYSVHGPKK